MIPVILALSKTVAQCALDTLALLAINDSQMADQLSNGLGKKVCEKKTK